MLTPQERFFCTVQEKVEKISKKYGTSPDGKINPILPLEQMTKDEREILAVHRNLQTDAQKNILCQPPCSESFEKEGNLDFAKAFMIKPVSFFHGCAALDHDIPVPAIKMQRCINTPPTANKPLSNEQQPATGRQNAKENTFSQMEWADLLLQRVHLKRDDDNIFQYENGSYKKLTDLQLSELIYENLRNELEVSGHSAQLSGVASFVKCDIRIKDIPIHDAHLLCLPNGILDLKSGELRPRSPSRFFTSMLTVPYNPNDCCCPVFQQFLQQITGGDQNLASFILEMFGYLLTYDMAAKTFFVLRGQGDTGKSVLGNLISSFFDPDDVSNVETTRFKSNFSTSILLDKRLNVCIDLPKSTISGEAVATIKQVVGQDAITVEQKFRNAKSSKLKCKFLFGTNHAMLISHQDDAFFRRLKEVPFCYPIPKEQQDPTLLQRLSPERSAILNLAIEGYLRLVDNNYIFTAFKTELPLETRSTYSSIDEAKYAAREFLKRYCYLEEEAFTATSSVHEAFCQITPDKVLTSSQISYLIKEIFGENIKHKKQRVNGIPLQGYCGLGFLPPPLSEFPRRFP